MARLDTQTEILEMFERILGVRDDAVRVDTPFARESAIDNIDVVKLVIACERRYRITIWDEVVRFFRCITDVARYVDERLAEGTNDLALHDDDQRNAWYYEY